MRSALYGRFVKRMPAFLQHNRARHMLVGWYILFYFARMNRHCCLCAWTSGLSKLSQKDEEHVRSSSVVSVVQSTYRQRAAICTTYRSHNRQSGDYRLPVLHSHHSTDVL